jgi:type VI secretion system protein ImpB
MASEGSVAPKERVNIVYKPATGDAQEEVELPLKVLMVGDYTGRTEGQPLEERKPINIDKDNFNEVMANQKIGVDLNVPNRLSDDPNAEMPVSLKFSSLNDFGPDGVVNQVPEMRKLLELRNALTALKGPLGNSAAFRKKIQGLISDPEGRQRLMKELGLKTESGPEEK